MTAANVGRSGAALTVAWSAPELFEDSPKSNATDVYALGVTLWEIYERRVPFGNMPEAAVVSQVMQGKRPGFLEPEDGNGVDEPGTPRPVRRIIEACWSAKAKERPPANKVAYILSELANPGAGGGGGGGDDDVFADGRTRWWRRGNNKVAAADAADAAVNAVRSFEDARETLGDAIESRAAESKGKLEERMRAGGRGRVAPEKVPEPEPEKVPEPEPEPAEPEKVPEKVPEPEPAEPKPTEPKPDDER